MRDGGSLGALRLNQNGESRRIFVYRNTFQGRIQVQNTDAADGPFTLSNNVIVNNDSGTPSGSHVFHSAVSAPSRIILSNNLVGYPSDNIVDTNGNLTARMRSPGVPWATRQAGRLLPHRPLPPESASSDAYRVDSLAVFYMSPARH